MKKLLLLCAVVLFSALTISARPTGFNVGGGFTYLGWTSNTDTKPLDYFGPYVEVGYDLKVANNSYIYFGGRFSHGINLEEAKGLVGGIGVYEYGMGDLFIPIRFQQNFNVGKNTTIYVEAGPAAGILLYNYCELTAGNDSSIGQKWEDLTYQGEPRGNVYLGGNIGVNIHKHVKIYCGGDYGLIQFMSGTYTANRWQLNFGACFVF